MLEVIRTHLTIKNTGFVLKIVHKNQKNTKAQSVGFVLLDKLRIKYVIFWLFYDFQNVY